MSCKILYIELLSITKPPDMFSCIYTHLYILLWNAVVRLVTMHFHEYNQSPKEFSRPLETDSVQTKPKPQLWPFISYNWLEGG